MKHLLAALAATLFLAVPARAADTLTITLVSDVPSQSGTVTKTWTFSQADMATFLSWVIVAYPCTAPCTPNVIASLNSWAQGFVNGTVANVTGWQTQAAQSAAAAAVVPVKPQ